MNRFWKKFQLKNNLQNEIKVIIGERPYKQSLCGVKFTVDGKNSNVPIYKEIGNIAFLVSDWIKVQDSLEMIFNLLFGKDKSLCALCFLKKLNISPVTFADSLWEKARIVLLNRCNKNDDDMKDKIKKFIKANVSSGKHVNVLFVGTKASSGFSLPVNCDSASAVHPSGRNLNKKPFKITQNAIEKLEDKIDNEKLKALKNKEFLWKELKSLNFTKKERKLVLKHANKNKIKKRYNDNWYNCKGNLLEKKTKNFIFDNFKLL